MIIILMTETIDVIFLFDPRKDSELATFNHIDIANYLYYINANTKVIHRINECDERKNTKESTIFYKCKQSCR